MGGPLRMLATGIGMAAFLGGIVLFASGLPLEETTGLALVLGEGVPLWLYAVALLGGLPLSALGAAIGMRYGNFERYHRDDDPETGTIDSDPPFARFEDLVSTDGSTPGDPPPTFVPSRPMLVVVTLAPFVLAMAFLASTGVFGPVLLGLAGAMVLL